MIVGLFTDAPNHNFALMRISQYHKDLGDTVILNMPILKADVRYGSWLYVKEKKLIPITCDFVGGPAFPNSELPEQFKDCKPDYSLFPKIKYSVGYTWADCIRKCSFCFVPRMGWKKTYGHRSIWEFHDPKFKEICLLNNNTFCDPYWRETFDEIWAADLTVRDENGYDLRLLDAEKATVLARTKFSKGPYFSWDNLKDEKAIVAGLRIAKKCGVRRTLINVLVGYNTTLEEDLYRCDVIVKEGFDPYPMLYRSTKILRKLWRFINLRYYKSYPSVTQAWENYRRLNSTLSERDGKEQHRDGFF